MRILSNARMLDVYVLALFKHAFALDVRSTMDFMHVTLLITQYTNDV